MAIEYKLSYTASDINTRLGKISSLAAKTDIPTAVSELTNDAGYLTSIPSEYITETELNEKGYLTEHQDLSVYALKADIPTAVSELENDSGYLTEHQSLDGLATEEYVTEQIASIPTPDISGQIETHNVATDSHNDIRLLIEGLTTRLNTLADSDDTTLDQMSELVAYIKSNKDLIDSITTDKVSVVDIVDNLTTNVSTQPLSAAQGVVLKSLIDNIEIPEMDLSEYALKSEIPSVDGLATEEYVETYVTEQISTSLGSYYTKEEIDTYELITTDDIDTICGAEAFSYDEDGNVSILSVFNDSTVTYDADGNVVIS